MKYFNCVLAIVLLAGCAIGGCGGGGAATGPGSEDDTFLVANLVSSLPDFATQDYVRFSETFAEGSAPKQSEAKKYGKYFFLGDHTSVKIEGDTATITVTIQDGGNDIGTQEWSLVKEDSVWKIKEAPLP
jgi:hypothetical protein